MLKRLIALIALVSVLITNAVSASILPASVAQDFTDGQSDILTMIGLVPGVITTIFIYKIVRRMFS